MDGRAAGLLETGVVVGRHAREHGDLIAAQAGGATTQALGQSDSGRLQALPAAAQEIGKFVAVHSTTVPHPRSAIQGLAIPR